MAKQAPVTRERKIRARTRHRGNLPQEEGKNNERKQKKKTGKENKGGLEEEIERILSRGHWKKGKRGQQGALSTCFIEAFFFRSQ